MRWQVVLSQSVLQEVASRLGNTLTHFVFSCYQTGCDCQTSSSSVRRQGGHKESASIGLGDDNVHLRDDPRSLLSSVRFDRVNNWYLKRDPLWPPSTRPFTVPGAIWQSHLVCLTWLSPANTQRPRNIADCVKDPSETEAAGNNRAALCCFNSNKTVININKWPVWPVMWRITKVFLLNSNW